MAEWHVRQAGGRPIGPVSTELVVRGIEAGKVAITDEVCKVGSSEWLPIEMVDEFADVSVDDDAATRVTESPWFADGASQPRILPPAPRPSSSLGLPRASLPSSPRVGPPPPPRRSSPSLPQPAELGYGEVDDETLTNVAHSPLEAGGASYEFDDETMTRVAAPRAADEPLGAPPRKPGLLATAPMWAGDAPEIRPVLPRPAAGAPPRESAIEVRADLLAGPPEMPPAPPGFGAPSPAFPPPAQPLEVARFGPTQPATRAEPARPYHAPQQLQQQPARTSDSGVMALIALIALLFVALMTVLILLVLRR